jgi:hypothetical protein
MPHSSRVGLGRQGTLPKLGTAEGRERFNAHVQIIENHGCYGWAYLWRYSIVFIRSYPVSDPIFITIFRHNA